MKNYLILLILFIFIGFMPNKALSSYVTGDMLKNYCVSEDASDVYMCANYIAGVIDYHLFMQSMGVMPNLGFCLPRGVSIEQASFIVKKYLENSQHFDPFIGASSVIMALNREFPCKQ